MGDLIVAYAKKGHAFADFLCEEVLLREHHKAEADTKDVLLATSTENMILAARALRGEGKLPNLRLMFVYGDIDEGEVEELKVDDDGRLLHWPKGFCDYADGWLHRLIDRRLGGENGRSTDC
jgi:predicted ATPase